MRRATPPAPGFSAERPTVHRRQDGVLAVHRVRPWSRALGLLAAGAFLLAPLVFALAFALPPALLPIPPLSLALLLWLLSGARAPTVLRPARERASRARVIPLRSARPVRRGSRPRS